jgi:hypothetical protein
MFETSLTSDHFVYRTPKGHSLFTSDDDALEFTENYREELSGIRAVLLERTGRILDAAELHISLRHISVAARLLKLVLSQLWERLPLGPPCIDSDAAALARRLENASRIETNLRLISRNDRDEVPSRFGCSI